MIVLSTFPADQDPTPLVDALIRERLAACVNVLPAMQSRYWWQGQVEHGSEHQLVIKTIASSLDAMQRRLLELHPYEVPEMLVLPVASGSEAYLQWVRSSVHAR